MQGQVSTAGCYFDWPKDVNSSRRTEREVKTCGGGVLGAGQGLCAAKDAACHAEDEGVQCAPYVPGAQSL